MHRMFFKISDVAVRKIPEYRVSKKYSITGLYRGKIYMWYNDYVLTQKNKYGSIFGKRALLAIDHIMLALFWSYVPNMK